MNFIFFIWHIESILLFRIFVFILNEIHLCTDNSNNKNSVLSAKIAQPSFDFNQFGRCFIFYIFGISKGTNRDTFLRFLFV